MKKEKRFEKVVEWEEEQKLILGIWIAVQNILMLLIISFYTEFEHLIEYTSFQGGVIILFMCSTILLFILAGILICGSLGNRNVYYKEVKKC